MNVKLELVQLEKFVLMVLILMSVNALKDIQEKIVQSY